MKNIVIAASLFLCSIPAFADQSPCTDANGAVTQCDVQVPQTVFEKISEAQTQASQESEPQTRPASQGIVVPGSAFTKEGPLADEKALSALEELLNQKASPAKPSLKATVAPAGGSESTGQVANTAPIPQVKQSHSTDIVIIERAVAPLEGPEAPELQRLPELQSLQLSTSVKTRIQGIDSIETRAVLPERLTVEQLDAVKNIVDSGVLIAQQRFGLEQYELETTHQMSRLRETKSFVLWGLILSIPFLLTSYWGLQRLATGWRKWRRDMLEHKLRELESVERQIADSERHYHEIQHS